MKPSADIQKSTSPPAHLELIPTGGDPHGFSFSDPAIAAERTDQLMTRLRHYANTPIAQSRVLMNQINGMALMQVSGDLSGEEKEERDRERLQGINYRSVIQMRKEANDSFDVQHAFKAMLKSKAEKVNNMMK